MVPDPIALVDEELRIYWIENLLTGDASFMPPIATTNTMARASLVDECDGASIRDRSA
jgi:hypothetical protein